MSHTANLFKAGSYTRRTCYRLAGVATAELLYLSISLTQNPMLELSASNAFIFAMVGFAVGGLAALLDEQATTSAVRAPST